MKKTLTIWSVDTEVALKMHVLAVAKGIPMADLLKSLVEQVWEQDNAMMFKGRKGKITKLVKKWVQSLSGSLCPSDNNQS